MRRTNRAGLALLLTGVLLMVPVAVSAVGLPGILGPATAGQVGERSLTPSWQAPQPASSIGPPPPSTYQPRTDCIRGDLGFMNAARKSQGLSALVWDEELFKTACAQAYYMAYYNQLTHWVYGTPWPFVAENVGFDTSVEEMNNAWLNSPRHRSIILDPGRNGAAALAYVITPYKGRQLYWGVTHFK